MDELKKRVKLLPREIYVKFFLYPSIVSKYPTSKLHFIYIFVRDNKIEIYRCYIIHIGEKNQQESRKKYLLYEMTLMDFESHAFMPVVL